MSNEFTTQDEIIFITYEDIIKSINPFIISQILQKYKLYYNEFLNLASVENLNKKQLDLFCIRRKDKNIFHTLAKKDFDCNTAMKELAHKFDDTYLNSELLIIGKTLGFIIPQKFTKKIYIYSKEYDKRIHLDIQMNFKDMNKVNYITGNLIDVINSIEGVTTYIFADIIDVTALLATNKIAYTNILVANYGYNYVLINDKLTLRINLEEHMKERIFKFVTFMPLSITSEHF